MSRWFSARWLGARGQEVRAGARPCPVAIPVSEGRPTLHPAAGGEFPISCGSADAPAWRVFVGAAGKSATPGAPPRSPKSSLSTRPWTTSTTLMAGVRPEVRAVLLDAATPRRARSRRRSRALKGLTCVHIMAHGAPGRVMFSAGAWSTGSLEWDARELAAIGGALGRRGRAPADWSCDTAAGATGSAFVEALARTTGAAVAAAQRGRVGAADKGGSWDLDARAGQPAEPPLSQARPSQRLRECW